MIRQKHLWDRSLMPGARSRVSRIWYVGVARQDDFQRRPYGGIYLDGPCHHDLASLQIQRALHGSEHPTRINLHCDGLATRSATWSRVNLALASPLR